MLYLDHADELIWVIVGESHPIVEYGRMKYQWTDWITHVPGQELVLGSYALFEFHGLFRNDGLPYQQEGSVTVDMKGHGCWRAVSPGDEGYCQLIRYKLRSIAEETEQQIDRTVACTPETLA